MAECSESTKRSDDASKGDATPCPGCVIAQQQRDDAWRRERELQAEIDALRALVAQKAVVLVDSSSVIALPS